jgi:hypothetical protein
MTQDRITDRRIQSLSPKRSSAVELVVLSEFCDLQVRLAGCRQEYGVVAGRRM